MNEEKLYTLKDIQDLLQGFMDQDWVDSEYLDCWAEKYLVKDFIEYILERDGESNVGSRN